MTDAIFVIHRRWSDNDYHFGPLTFAYIPEWKPFAAIVSSGSDERESPGCCIRFQGFGFAAICELPSIIKPWRKWIDLRDKEWAHGDGYWDEHPQEYGFILSNGHLSIKFGAQTNDSLTTQDWGCFLPWTQWRQIAHRLYHVDGALVADVAFVSWDKFSAIKDTVQRSNFSITDYDGEQIAVQTYVEEREWRLGTGWFKWLGYFIPKKRRRSLDISFSSEVGPEKGSWKGGTMGHGIDMLPNETQEQAFRRYCDQDQRSKYRKYHITFNGGVAE